MIDLTDFQRGGYFVDLPAVHVMNRDCWRRHAVRILCTDFVNGDRKQIVGAVLFADGQYEKLAIWQSDGTFDRMWSILPRATEHQPGDPMLRLQRE